MNVSEYAKSNKRCELCGRLADHTHHIWGGTRRINHLSNLIRLCLGCHDLVHAVPTIGRIRCMQSKCVKDEFDLAELSECAGRNVIGWIENQGTPESFRLLSVMRFKGWIT